MIPSVFLYIVTDKLNQTALNWSVIHPPKIQNVYERRPKLGHTAKQPDFGCFHQSLCKHNSDLFLEFLLFPIFQGTAFRYHTPTPPYIKKQKIF